MTQIVQFVDDHLLEVLSTSTNNLAKTRDQKLDNLYNQALEDIRLSSKRKHVPALRFPFIRKETEEEFEVRCRNLAAALTTKRDPKFFEDVVISPTHLLDYMDEAKEVNDYYNTVINKINTIYINAKEGDVIYIDMDIYHHIRNS